MARRRKPVHVEVKEQWGASATPFRDTNYRSRIRVANSVSARIEYR